jgi:hypothetical protein
MAREHGYGSADQSWLTRSVAGQSAAQSRPSNELSLADLSFHSGRLVALRVGTYDPRTKRVSYRRINLCGHATPSLPMRSPSG